VHFLTPLFLVAAVAVIGPILLHLTRREVKRPTLFASLMFLRRIPVRETRRRKIHNWLVLLARCMAILLLAAAFARPVVDRYFLAAVTPGARQSVVLLLDTSLSMSRETVRAEAFDAADRVVRSLGRGDEVSVVGFGVRPEVLVPWTRDLEWAGAALRERLAPSFEATSFAAGLRAAVSQIDEARNLARSIVLVSDLQASGLDLLGSGIEIPEDVDLVVKGVGVEQANFFIEQVRMERLVYSESYPHSVVVRLGASGSATAGTGSEVRLFLGDDLADSRSFSWGESGTATVDFDAFGVPEGITRGRLVLSSTDAMPEDDIRYFVLERSPPFDVRLVRENGSDGGSGFLEDALSSGRNLPFRVDSGAGLGNVSAATTPVVVLGDLPRPPAVRGLLSFLEEGGGLVVALGNRVRADEYNRLLADLLPGRLRERRFSQTGGEPFVSLGELAVEHPVFSAFQGTGENSLSTVQFYGYWVVSPTEDSRVVARFSTGDPALLERRVGQGRVLLFTSSLDRVWSDFPVRTAYVPFWQGLILYASEWRARPAAKLVHHALAVDSTAGERRWDVLDPRGRRLVPLGDDGPGFIQLETPGHYELRRDRSTDWVAANVDTAESDLTSIDEEEFLAAMKTLRSPRSTVAAAGSPAEEERASLSLWWAFLLAAAAVLLAESFLANRTATTVRG
jgi:hypothetical protein